MTSKEKECWKKAVKDELDSMQINNVWKLVDRPRLMSDGKKANIIDSKWIFKKKLETGGSTQFKARLVIRGFKDRTVYDLKETYAPVSRLPVVRSLLAIINKYDLFACQLDVKTAFLNGVLDEEIYMEIPDALEFHSHTKETKVCKLERALYSLKISPKKWNKRFSEETLKLGLENDLHEPCLFTWRKAGKMAVILLYADDMLISSNDRDKLSEIKIGLSNAFEMKDLGEPKRFLGISIVRNHNKKSLVMQQANHIENILERFNMHTILKIKNVPYRETIGSLMYLSNATRPNITFAVNYMA